MSTERKSPAWPQLGVLAPGEEAETHFMALGLKKKNKLKEMKFSNLAFSASLSLIMY